MKNHIEGLEQLTNRDWSMERTIFTYRYYYGTKESFEKAAEFVRKKAELTSFKLREFPLYYFCTGQKEIGYQCLENAVKNGNNFLDGKHRYSIDWDIIKDEERYKALYGDNY